MTRKDLTNVGASVRERLLNRARERGESHQDLLTRYTIERFLYRLGESSHRERFVLKGAMLFQLWMPDAGRQTRDIDMLGHGDMSPDTVAAAFREVLAVPVEADGLEFDADAMTVAPIRANTRYGGVEVHIPALLGGAELVVHVDIGVGDVVHPPPEEVFYPSLLEFPQPRLRAYPREAVIAEKLHAMVLLGLGNTRVKDYFDLWSLSASFPFDGSTLREAVHATFGRRGTPVPTALPVALRPDDAVIPERTRQWRGFLRRAGLGGDAVPPLEEVVRQVATFVAPLLGAAPPVRWPPGGPWQERENT